MMTTVIVVMAQMNQEQMLVQTQSKMRAQKLPKSCGMQTNDNFILCICFSDFTVQVERSTCHPLALMMVYVTVVMALMNGKK